MRIKDLGEFGLIERIRKKNRLNRDVLMGIGDDTAVLRSLGPSDVMLMTVDNVLEGVHFSKGTPWRKIGRKALARSLSDIAAMGGVPLYALVSLGLHQKISLKDIDHFFEGFLQLAKDSKVSLVGGDMTHSPKTFFASTFVFGKAPRNKSILRKGACIDDLIFVTGKLGGSIAGKHLSFQPRIAEAQWLSQHKIPTSMIDVSDGMMADLDHILKESCVSAAVDLSKIPISNAAIQLSKGNKISALKRALYDGEDYELLFTSSLKDLSWVHLFKKNFDITVTPIGHILKGRRSKIYEEKNHKEISGKGFTHF